MPDDMKPNETPVETSEQDDDVEQLNKDIERNLKASAAKSEENIRKDFNEWKRSVELRLGKTTSLFTGGYTLAEGDVRNEANPDWSLTKTKTANLFSQVPTVRATHRHIKDLVAIPPFEKAINYELGDTRARAKVAVKEVLNDVVNAAGIGMIRIDWAARFEKKVLPKVGAVPQGMPPDVAMTMAAKGLLETEEVDVPVDSRLTWTRRSPTDILYSDTFLGSDFDDADWVGEKGRMPWSVGKHEFKLDDDDEKKLTQETGDQDRKQQSLASGLDKAEMMAPPSIRYKELFYWRYRYDVDCKNFSEIWRIVFVDGKDKAVVHEQWEGQQYDQQTSKLIGARRFPLRFLTLTYITDNPRPPSDSSVARPSVNDLRRSRSQMFQNRQYNLPWRWFNTSLVDPMAWDNMMKGNIQGAIPVNGSGERAFGEIARASYPPEDFTFDQMTQQDLSTYWGLGPNQMGNFGGGRRTKGEVQTVQENFATVMGQERDAVATFFLGCVDVMAGLMVLYSDWPMLDQEEQQLMFGSWGGKHVIHDLMYKIRPDSTIVLDVPQRLQRLERFINFTAKSGLVDLLPVLMEYAELSGIDDPTKVVHPPVPPPPQEPNVNIRVAGKEDMNNVGVMAMLAKLKKLPGPQEIKQAVDVLNMIQQPELLQQALEVLQQQQAAQQGPPGARPPAPGGPAGRPQPQGGLNANKGWTLGDKIMKRSRDAQ